MFVHPCQVLGGGIPFFQGTGICKIVSSPSTGRAHGQNGQQNTAVAIVRLLASASALKNTSFEAEARRTMGTSSSVEKTALFVGSINASTGEFVAVAKSACAVAGEIASTSREPTSTASEPRATRRL